MDRVLVKYRSVMESPGDPPIAEFTDMVPVERAKDFVEKLKDWPLSGCWWSRDSEDLVPDKGTPVVWRWMIGTEPTGYSIHWLYEDEEDRPVVSLEELVFLALGAASTCWSPSTGDAVFDSTTASHIGKELVATLRARGAR